MSLLGPIISFRACSTPLPRFFFLDKEFIQNSLTSFSYHVSSVFNHSLRGGLLIHWHFEEFKPSCFVKHSTVWLVIRIRVTFFWGWRWGQEYYLGSNICFLLYQEEYNVIFLPLLVILSWAFGLSGLHARILMKLYQAQFNIWTF